ncbi:AraC family transcriptional regulator [Streptomyces sp. NBC_01352]|uniref:helix-turn-helix transcriptional regulator n=1 Tax=Streptomyces sp. NBC_01352 TaxID=2903834 RepID=UPI002E2F30C4|nr:AraC family transcriptional regulator [Streptomyces sp. NBC_01352]
MSSIHIERTLARFTRVRSTDPDNFLAAVNDVYGSAEVVAAGRPRHGQVYEVRGISGKGFAIGYVSSGLDVRIVPDHVTGPYYLNFATSGALTSQAGRDEAVNDQGTAIVMPAGDPQWLHPHAAGTECIGIRIDQELVESELTALLGREPADPVRFAFGLDLTSVSGRGVAALVRMLLTEADRPPGGLFDQPAVRLHYVRTLVTALLTTHPHSYTDSLRRPAGRAQHPRVLRHALEYIEAHLADPMTIGDIAAAAGCSARTLHDYFQDGLHTSPMGYVRDLRLRRAHRELRNTGQPVTEVAYAAGFTHLGRFSAAYRKRFGVLPSETARGS